MFSRGLHRQAINNVKALKQNQLAIAAGTVAYSEVDGVLGLLSDLQDGVGPQQARVESYSEHFKLCANRLEFLFSFEKPLLSIVDGKATEVVYGRDALTLAVEELKSFELKGKLPTLPKLQPLRQFSWLLKPADISWTDQWISEIVLKESRALMPALPDKVKEVSSSCTLRFEELPAAASSSDSIATMPIQIGTILKVPKDKFSKPSKSKKGLKEDKTNGTDKGDIMKFFASGTKKKAGKA